MSKAAVEQFGRALRLELAPHGASASVAYFGFIDTEMLAPYAGASEAMTTLMAECKARGMIPFMNYNRLHVVPPCTISEAEAKEGLAILDEALAAIGRFYTG